MGVDINFKSLPIVIQKALKPLKKHAAKAVKGIGNTDGSERSIAMAYHVDAAA